MAITKVNGTKKVGIVSKVAAITGFSESYIRKVQYGERDNELIMEALLEVRKKEDELQHELSRKLHRNTVKRG